MDESLHSCFKRKGILTFTHRFLLIFDRYKAHLILDVLTKVKRNGIDMLTIPSHTSHGLQPLNVACFKPSKWLLRPTNKHGMLKIMDLK